MSRTRLLAATVTTGVLLALWLRHVNRHLFPGWRP